MSIQLKRAYEAPDASDGYRVLIDRLWPRGVSKEAAHLDEWAQEQERLREQVAMARDTLADVTCPPDILAWISRTVSEHGVCSLRADLAIVRASLAKAASSRHF